jgi:hypothetical protein
VTAEAVLTALGVWVALSVGAGLLIAHVRVELWKPPAAPAKRHVDWMEFGYTGPPKAVGIVRRRENGPGQILIELRARELERPERSIEVRAELLPSEAEALALRLLDCAAREREARP